MRIFRIIKRLIREYREKRYLCYKVNIHTKEIHYMKNKKSSCKHELMAAHNYRLVNKKTAMELINSGKYNGCSKCLKDFDTDNKYNTNKK